MTYSYKLIKLTILENGNGDFEMGYIAYLTKTSVLNWFQRLLGHKETVQQVTMIRPRHGRIWHDSTTFQTTLHDNWYWDFEKFLNTQVTKMECTKINVINMYDQ